MRVRNRLRTMLFLALGLGLLICSTAAGGTAREVAQKTLPSVFLLVMEDANGQPLSLGSGFLVADGVIATNHHVVEGAAGGYVKRVGESNKQDIRGIVADDVGRDLALLSVAAPGGKPLPLGDSASVSVGDKVYAAGNPRGLEGTFSEGIISGVRTVGSDSVLQITAPISPGSSGGPVLDSEGRVVGVAAVTFTGGQNLNFAIPSAYVRALLSRAGEPRPLAPKRNKGSGESLLDKLGGRSTEGVVGGSLTWTYAHMQAGNYSFSIRNRLREPVRNVYCLLVFYDSGHNPIDVDIVHYRGSIPAGLAKRVESKVHSSVQELTTRDGSATPRTKVELRVLDFEIVE